jgi:hypothetical protein
LLRELFYFLWVAVTDGRWLIESHYPTQAKRRLEWGTQHLLPVWQKLMMGFPPAFLLSLVVLANLMRLSLLKAAHVDVGECT